MNLVELILKQLISGDVLGKLGGILGANADDTKKAINAAIPALLGGIGSVASKPDGADRLWKLLKQVDDSHVSDFGGILSGDRRDQFAKSGNDMLETLFGKGMLSSLISVLGSFLGGKNAMITKLLPLLAPMVMGMIGRQVKSGGLDLGGLTKLLLGQKGNIASAMPQGLLNALSGTQGLGDLVGFAKGVTSSAESAARGAAAAASEAASPAKWLLPLLLLAAILIGGYWWMNRTQPAAVDVVADVADLTSKFTSMFETSSKTLAGITDAASAEAAVPALEDMSNQLDTLKEALGLLPPASRSQLTQMIDESTKTFQQEADKVMALPGVGDILKSIIEGIVQKLVALVTG